MSKTKTPPPFDAVETALRVRQGQVRLHTLSPEEQMHVRKELRSTGALRTKLLRRGNHTPEGRATSLVPTTRFRDAYSS